MKLDLRLQFMRTWLLHQNDFDRQTFAEMFGIDDDELEDIYGLYYDKFNETVMETVSQGVRLRERDLNHFRIIQDEVQERICHQEDRFLNATAPWALWDPLIYTEACAVLGEESGELARAICEGPKSEGGDARILFEATQVMAVAYQIARGALNRMHP